MAPSPIGSVANGGSWMDQSYKALQLEQQQSLWSSNSICRCGSTAGSLFYCDTTWSPCNNVYHQNDLQVASWISLVPIGHVPGPLLKFAEESTCFLLCLEQVVRWIWGTVTQYRLMSFWYSKFSKSVSHGTYQLWSAWSRHDCCNTISWSQCLTLHFDTWPAL